jgi:hypothetical protein
MQGELVRLWFPLIVFVLGIVINFVSDRSKVIKFGELLYMAGIFALCFKF